MVTTELLPMTQGWMVSDTDSLSDHKYIMFKIAGSNAYNRRHRLETKFGKHRKFEKAVRVINYQYRTKVESAKNKEELEETILEIQEKLTKNAQECYRERKPPPPKPPTWWTPELKAFRNKVRARRRQFQAEANDGERSKKWLLYKEEQAKFKKVIRMKKSRFWKTMCTETTETYGPLYRRIIKQNYSENEIVNVTPGAATSSIKEIQKAFLKTLFVTTPPTPVGNQQSEAEIVNAARTERLRIEPPITLEEVRQIIKAQKKNKAPGYDKIDLKLVKRIQEAAPNLLTAIIKKCFELAVFPRSFKKAVVVLFKKPGKKTTEAKSYRPICLLPAIGKLLERVIQGRLTHFLEKNHKISPNQFGFRVLKNTEVAIDKVLETIKEDKRRKQQTTAVSIDISGAFDNIRWQIVIENLEKKHCPSYLVKIINSYLMERTVQLTTNGQTTELEAYRGCPQGSCLGPIFWNVIADELLNYPFPKTTRIQAFADDFILLNCSPTKTQLIERTNYSLKVVEEWTRNQGLQINWEKTQLMYLNRPLLYNFQQEATYEIEGIRVGTREIKARESITYLGLEIHNSLRWEKHCLNQKVKALQTFKSLGIIAKSTWGVNPKIIKSWYSTVAEKILLYAAPNWALERLSPRCQAILISAQRFFTLAITKAYRTAPSTALNVLSGVEPICLKAELEAKKGALLRLKKPVRIGKRLALPVEYEEKENHWLYHPARQTLKIKEPETVEMDIYTDGSKLETGATGAAFVAYEERAHTYTQHIHLQPHNSVFQAELAAILEAVRWSEGTGKNSKIHTDSESSILALEKPFNQNPLINKIKQALKQQCGRIGLQWVKAHVGIEGNEAADKAAKHAAEEAHKNRTYELPKPRSHLKAELKDELQRKWQARWDNNKTNPKPCKTYKYIQTVSTQTLYSCRLLNQILTEHGATPFYLHRFKKKNTPKCSCGRRGTVDHYLLKCPYTKSLHLRTPAPQGKKLWYRSIAGNRHVSQKATKIAGWLAENIDKIST